MTDRVAQVRVAHVDAQFGGEAVRFELLRDDLSSFEAAAGAPAIAVLNRLTHGAWWVGDIHLVLRSAHPLGYGTSNDPVGEVIRERSPMRYLTLAIRVLEAALIGLLPGEARFDEDRIDEDDGER